MAITVDWGQRIINVPRADMQLVQSVPTEIRQLNLDAFRLDLKDLEDNAEGMAYLDTHRHVQPITVGGVTLARVVEIINNYTISFEDGQYAVNLIGANSNVGDVVNVNQVSVRSANSAGLTFSEEINAQSFLNASVYIDTTNGQPGTGFPRGTPTSQVNNYTDARAIADFRGFDSFVLTHALAFSAVDNTEQTFWQGKSPVLAALVFAGNSTLNSEFQNLAVSGQMNGFCALRDCRIAGLTDFWGTARECLLQGDVVLDPATTGPIVFAGCTSGVPGAGKPTLDVNEADVDVQVRNYTGGLLVQNFSQGRNMSIDVHSGTIELDASCTSGVIVVRGVAKLIDNSGPGCTVISDGLLEPTHVDDVWALHGLDAANPMTVTPTSRVTGDINQVISGDGENTSTVTRQ